MTVSADAAGSLDITITNNSDVDIDMGEDFSLQKWTVKHGKIYHCH